MHDIMHLIPASRLSFIYRKKSADVTLEFFGKGSGPGTSVGISDVALLKNARDAYFSHKIPFQQVKCPVQRLGHAIHHSRVMLLAAGNDTAFLT